MQNHSKQRLAIHDLHALPDTLVKPEICQAQRLVINLFRTISTYLKELELEIYFWKKSVQDDTYIVRFYNKYLKDTLFFFWSGPFLKRM